MVLRLPFTRALTLGSARLLCDQESSGCINDLFIAGFHFLDGEASTAGFENIIGKHGGIPHLQGDGAGNSYDCFRYCEGHLFRLISISKKKSAEPAFAKYTLTSKLSLDFGVMPVTCATDESEILTEYLDESLFE